MSQKDLPVRILTYSGGMRLSRNKRVFPELMIPDLFFNDHAAGDSCACIARGLGLKIINTLVNNH